ncbi:MAG: hypothetical protein IIU55_01465 [Paludibacteraceae bacterium]|nr:hypothetical protein [Paludibacteraceae bacterium]
MKKIFSLAIIAMALVFTGCDQNKPEQPDNYADYPQLIVGKWFNFTPEASTFLDYKADGSFGVIGFDQKLGWMQFAGTYQLQENKLTLTRNGNISEAQVELTSNKFTFKNYAETGDKVHYRVQEQFDIKGNYSYLNSAVRVVAAEGKTALQLPEGVTFQGQNAIPVDAMHGDRIIDVMKRFFADATFAADGKLNHTLDGEAKTKNYTLDGNNLTFNLYEGSETYKVNATSFPDEDGDRLFIIIPKQAAWLGGMVDLVEKENEGLTLTEAQIAELEKEFMATFETFTVILSLSKK